MASVMLAASERGGAVCEGDRVERASERERDGDEQRKRGGCVESARVWVVAAHQTASPSRASAWQQQSVCLSVCFCCCLCSAASVCLSLVLLISSSLSHHLSGPEGQVPPSVVASAPGGASGAGQAALHAVDQGRHDQSHPARNEEATGVGGGHRQRRRCVAAAAAAAAAAAGVVLEFGRLELRLVLLLLVVVVAVAVVVFMESPSLQISPSAARARSRGMPPSCPNTLLTPLRVRCVVVLPRDCRVDCWMPYCVARTVLSQRLNAFAQHVAAPLRGIADLFHRLHRLSEAHRDFFEKLRVRRRRRCCRCCRFHLRRCRRRSRRQSFGRSCGCSAGQWVGSRPAGWAGDGDWFAPANLCVWRARRALAKCFSPTTLFLPLAAITPHHTTHLPHTCHDTAVAPIQRNYNDAGYDAARARLFTARPPVTGGPGGSEGPLRHRSTRRQPTWQRSRLCCRSAGGVRRHHFEQQQT
jgi:hypothetical protein